MDTVKLKGTNKAKVIKVIRTETVVGSGEEKDPVRLMYQYWDFKGNLLAQQDGVMISD